jgi:hypothetical protein
MAAAHRRAQIFRLAFGMTLSSGVAFGLAWPLSFLTPVLTAKLLTLPKVMPFKAALSFVVIMGGSFILGARLLLPTLSYPAVHLLVTALILFLLFYAKAGGTNPILVVFLLLGALLVPLMGTVAESLALAVVWGLTFALVVAIAMVYVAAAVFPDPPGLGPTVASASQGPGGGGVAADGPPSPRLRTAMALRSLVVLYPLVVVLQLFSLVQFAVVLVMASLLALEPTFGKHLAVGKALILTNLAGGLVAVVLYQLLVMVPSFTFLLLVVFLAGLWVGGWIFSDRPLGKLLGGGITTVFIILGPTLTGDAQAGSALVLRLALIMGAVVYVVTAFGLLERLTRGRRQTA